MPSDFDLAVIGSDMGGALAANAASPIWGVAPATPTL